MAKKRIPSSPRRPRSASPRKSGAAGKTALAFALGAAVAAGAGYLYLHSAPRQPVATTPAVPAASAPAPVPPAPELRPTPVRSAPFGISEDVFEGGARTYSAHCARCHGTQQKDAPNAPAAQQLWRTARRTLAAKRPGDLYNEIAEGAPGKGMPAYSHTLTDTQIWQLALLLQDADADLPDPVRALLSAPPRGASAASR